MRIQYKEWTNPLDLEDNKLNVIKFENKQKFYKFVSDVLDDEKGSELFYITDGITEQKFINVFLTEINLFNLELNDKKYLTLLYKKIQKNQTDVNENNDTLEKINEEISSLIKKNIVNLNLPITFSENLNLVDFLKFYEVKFNFNNSEALLKLTNYIEVLQEFTQIKILFLPYLETILNKNEVDKFIDFVKKRGIFIITCNIAENNELQPKKIVDKEDDEIEIIL